MPNCSHFSFALLVLRKDGSWKNYVNKVFAHLGIQLNEVAETYTGFKRSKDVFWRMCPETYGRDDQTKCSKITKKSHVLL